MPGSSMMIAVVVIVVVLGSSLLIEQVSAHGRLIEPPSRASMWRYGFDTPHDYNDHESYCGGFARQWQRNKGKCGICGDAWDLPEPRAHETGGKYGKGVIVRRYRGGSVIPVRVELTANHQGFFEFRVCPVIRPLGDASQECLDRYLLRGENGTARYYPGPGAKIFESRYVLPDGLECSHCVFQWRYVAGNNWGDCGNGTGAVGCGPQEEFRACADVAIGGESGTTPATGPTKATTTPATTTTTTTTTATATASTPLFTSKPYRLYGLVIAGTCLLVVLAAMALLYAYYYHADKAKKWLMARRLCAAPKKSSSPLPAPPSPPVAPPRHKKHYHHLLNAQVQQP